MLTVHIQEFCQVSPAGNGIYIWPLFPTNTVTWLVRYSIILHVACLMGWTWILTTRPASYEISNHFGFSGRPWKSPWRSCFSIFIGGFHDPWKVSYLWLEAMLFPDPWMLPWNVSCPLNPPTIKLQNCGQLLSRSYWTHCSHRFQIHLTNLLTTAVADSLCKLVACCVASYPDPHAERGSGPWQNSCMCWDQQSWFRVGESRSSIANYCIHTQRHLHVLPSLLPRPTPFHSVLRFALTDAEERHPALRHSPASVYYCQRKPKNRKKGLGLRTRLYMCYQLWLLSPNCFYSGLE